MGIADFFRPKHRHSDVRVRIEAVRAMTAEDAATLLQIARTDREAAVRRVAIEKIDKADVLAELAAAEADARRQRGISASPRGRVSTRRRRAAEQEAPDRDPAWRAGFAGDPGGLGGS
jgi:hypothetical protein